MCQNRADRSLVTNNVGLPDVGLPDVGRTAFDKGVAHALRSGANRAQYLSAVPEDPS